MEDKPVGHGTIYGTGSPQDTLQPIEPSKQEAAEQKARRQRRAHVLEDPALLGFDPYSDT